MEWHLDVKDVSLIPNLLPVKFESLQNDGLIMRYAFNVIDGWSATKYEPALNQDWPTHRLHEWVWQRDLFTVWYSAWDLSKLKAPEKDGGDYFWG